ncbi:MAG: ATP-dependent DNA helicase PcrA, partial [Candidatus Cloacimonetes bacterium 4572_65]
MSIDKMLNELNEKQREAVTHSGSHALVLAGAGCGKTKTIISRAAYLISEGVDPKRIQILTFTKRSASEIVSRVENFMGEESKGLQASTFHTWCLSIIKKSGNAFNVKDFTIIDRDDQLQLFKLYKNKNDDKENGAVLLKPAKICDLYSYSRNT